MKKSTKIPGNHKENVTSKQKIMLECFFFHVKIIWECSGGMDKRIKTKTKKKEEKRMALIMMAMSTYPTGFTLVFECFFGILCCRLDVIHCMFNVIFYAIDHFALFLCDFFFGFF